MLDHNSLLVLEIDRISTLLDEYGIPADNNGRDMSPADRVEEALLRLKARGHNPK